MAKQKVRELKAPRGTHDILPLEQRLWRKLYEEAMALSGYYGFERIDTPHFEHTELFTLGTGETTDIVTKQMYSFRTRGGDQLTLRPEGTPPIMRAFFEHGMINWPQPVKLTYWGSFFRHESPQRGRYREFRQWGLELLGEDSPVAEAQIIRVFTSFLQEIGLKGTLVEVNSIGCQVCRAHYRSELAAYYRARVRGLCKNCKERFRENPLRLLDCKEEKCQTVRQGAPQMLDHLCDDCKNHFKLFLEFLEEAGIEYLLNPYLVRGLDYYTRTVFEIFVQAEEVSAKTVAEPPKENVPEGTDPVPPVEEKQPHREETGRLALGGGGRYDNLAELLDGKTVPASGGAIGMERVILAWKTQGLKLSEAAKPKAFLAQLGELARKKSFPFIEELRKARISIAESLGRDSIKSQLKIADRLGVEFTLIMGQKEALDGTIILREMSSGNQEIVPQDKLIETLKKRLRK